MKSLTLVPLLTAVLLTAPALAAQSGGAGPAPGGGVNAKNGEICASTYNALLNAEAEADNRALMLSDGAVAWLDVPLAQVMKRVPNDGRRPLAGDRAAMEQLYQRRQLAYAQAHVRIDSTRPVPEVVEHLLEWVGF